MSSQVLLCDVVPVRKFASSSVPHIIGTNVTRQSNENDHDSRFSHGMISTKWSPAPCENAQFQRNCIERITANVRQSIRHSTHVAPQRSGTGDSLKRLEHGGSEQKNSNSVVVVPGAHNQFTILTFPCRSVLFVLSR